MARSSSLLNNNDESPKEVIRSANDFYDAYNGWEDNDQLEWEVVDYEAGANYE
jgi:hypothetical protein